MTVELKVVAHVHSDFSHNGSDSIEQIAQTAESKGVDALLLTDTAIADWRYGLWSTSHLLSVRKSSASILEKGPEAYLEAIARVQKNHPRLLIVPGAEASAYYRWDGAPWRTLTAHDWNRHLLLVGLNQPSDYKELPVLGNSKGFPISWFSFWPLSILLLAFCGRKARIPILPTLLALLGIVFLIDSFPFTGSPNPYLKLTPWEPYRELVEYAHRHHALAFVAHPEASNWSSPVPVAPHVQVQTAPYPEAIEELPADGFGVYLEGYAETPVPGGPWDTALKDYCSGRRKNPAWAIAEVDYKGKGRGPDIDEVHMIVTAKERTEAALLEALRSGSFYSVYPIRSRPLKLSWSLTGAELSVQASRIDGASLFADLTVIHNGTVFRKEKKKLPATWSMMVPPEDDACGYYRLVLEDAFGGAATSNPIFTRRQSPTGN